MIKSFLLMASLLIVSIKSNDYFEDYYYYNNNLNNKSNENIQTRIEVVDKPHTEPQTESEIKQNNNHLSILDDIFLPVLFNYCSFSCDKPNKKKLAKPKYIAKSNGCGSYGFNFNFETIHIKGFNECCNQHDICYETCNNDKRICDKKFESCLLNQCVSSENISSELFKHRDDIKECRDIAKSMFITVEKLGCKAFKLSQSNSCICV